MFMKAIFIELPVFAKYRPEYLDDEGFRDLQNSLMANPEAGDVIEGTGGLRKIRQPDPRRGKGKRGGLRVIYTGGTASGNSGCSPCMTKMSWMT
jgi:hypothetical protein